MWKIYSLFNWLILFMNFMLSTHGFSISNSFLKNIKRYPSNVDNSDNRIFKKSINLSMKWLFNKGMGSMTDLGGIGSQGEYYYIQSMI